MFVSVVSKTTKNVFVSLETQTRKMSITVVDSFRTLLIEY